MKSTAALVLLLACAVTAQIDLGDKRLLFPLGTDKLVNIEGAAKKLPQYTLNRDSKTNERCYTASGCGSEYLAKSSFTQVLDTGLGLTICLCDGYTMGAAEIARKFSYVPAPLRSAVNLISSKAPAADSSYSVNNAISLMGANSINTLVREAAHTFDTANGASNSNEFQNALRKDACVIDGQATLSASEAWSSTVLLWSYFLVSNNASHANDAAYKCWAEQKKVVESYLPVESTPANFFTADFEVVPLTMRSSALGVGKDGFTITTAAATKSKWHFIRASGKSFLICETAQHLCLDAYGRRANGDAPLLFSRRNAGINQRWNLASNNGAYTFGNQANDLFLDIASCSRFSNSTNAVMAQQSVSNCQKWTLKEIPKPKPSTFTKTHSVSYTDSAKKSESYTYTGEPTHTKTQTATKSQQGTDKVSSSRSFRDTAPHAQTFSVQIQPGRTISASKTVVDTGSRQQVYTGTVLANKTRTATESQKASTFTKPTKSKTISRTVGPSFTVSKTRSEAPTSKPTASYTFTASDSKRASESFSATDLTKSKSRTASTTAFKTAAASTIMTHKNSNGTSTRQILISVPSNKTRTITVSAPDTNVKSATYTKTQSRPVGSSWSISGTKSNGPTHSVSKTETHALTTKPDQPSTPGGATKPKTYSASRTVSASQMVTATKN